MPRANLLRYVRPITGRDGVVRYYFRRRGHKDVRLPGPFAGEAFMAAYAAALGNAERSAPRPAPSPPWSVSISRRPRSPGSP